MAKPIEGVIPVAHTPFTENDEIDWASLERQVNWAIDCGANGICTGMVSELLRLTADERVELTRRLGTLVDGRVSLVMSVGAESTKQAVLFARHAAESGCDGLMAVPPLSARLSPESMLAYFSAIATATELPLLVQDASGYVGQAIPGSVYETLLREFGPQKIYFKPESAPVGAVISYLRDLTHGDARVFDGSGGNLLIDSWRRGICGTIPGMEFLDAVIAIWRALQNSDYSLAYQIYFPLCALVTLQLQAGLDGFLAVEKYILHQRGLFTTSRRRRPYAWELDAETQGEVDRLLDLLQASLQKTRT